MMFDVRTVNTDSLAGSYHGSHYSTFLSDGYTVLELFSVSVPSFPDPLHSILHQFMGPGISTQLVDGNHHKMLFIATSLVS